LLQADFSVAMYATYGAEIRKLNFGGADAPVLKLLRRVLRDARDVAKAERQKVR
jgi:hypothetical protein